MEVLEGKGGGDKDPSECGKIPLEGVKTCGIHRGGQKQTQASGEPV